jgi:inner membrane protein
MHREGHIGLGLLLYAPVAYYLTATDQLTLMAVGLIAAVVHSYAPDFDLWLPRVSHRGITHTVVGGLAAAVLTVALVVGFIAGGFTTLAPSLAEYGFIAGFTFIVSMTGFVSHLLGDVLTPMGIRPFRPWNDRQYSLELVYASNEAANEGLATAGAVGLTAAIVLGTVGISTFTTLL